MLNKLIKDEAGTTPIEYGMIALIVSVGIIIAVSVLGDDIYQQWVGQANSALSK